MAISLICILISIVTLINPMELQSLKIKLPADIQIVLTQSHFVKTVEDVSECLVSCVPNIKYGIAFYEASGPC